MAELGGGPYLRRMTLLTEIIRVLHAADVPAYSVHRRVRDQPGDPDLVVNLTGDVDQQAADLLVAAGIAIGALERVGPGVIHVWEVDPPVAVPGPL